MLKNFFTNLIYRKEKSPKSKYRWAVFCVVILIIAIGGYAAPAYYNGIIKKINSKFSLNISEITGKPFHLGLDLQGGTHLVYKAHVDEVAESNKEKEDALERVRDRIERRVNIFGLDEPIIQTNRSGGNWRLIVELAGVKDASQAIAMIGKTGILKFKEENTEPPRDLTEEERKQMDEFNQLALEKARDIIKKFDNGEDFAKLAKEFSEDPGSGQNGGELGFAKRGMMVAEFEKAIFEDLQDGETTKEPIKTIFGYHIIQKQETRGGIQPDGIDNTEIRSSHILIRTKSEIDFVPPVEQWISTGLSGKQLEKSMVEFNPTTNEPSVSLSFDSEGKKLFAEITERNVGKKVAIFLDGTPISVPTVNEPIRDGKAIITGSFDNKEAKQLSQILNEGALPVRLTLISQNTVGASLGKLSLEKSLKAGIIGLLAIILFMLVVYKFKGVVAVISLIIYGVIIVAMFKFLSITITLAGLAGLILSIGMAVDANVLIFERMKEERKNGKRGLQLIEDGIKRAWPSIRDGNISTLITCLILIWFSTSMVKGFAITLGIGILISMFCAVVITKLLLKAFSK